MPPAIEDLTTVPVVPEFVYIDDSGWGGVAQAVAIHKATKDKVAQINYIKNNFAAFPKDALEEMLRWMPGGSHMELDATIDGVELIARGSLGRP